MVQVIKELNKARTLAQILMEDYGITDVKNPTKEESSKYRLYCVEIHTLIELLSDCLDNMDSELTDAMEGGVDD